MQKIIVKKNKKSFKTFKLKKLIIYWNFLRYSKSSGLVSTDRKGIKVATVKISHNALKSNNRLTKATTFQQEFFPVYHLIAVEPDVDILLLDNDMTAEVLVPIDTPLWVNYINWTEEQPNIHYQYGVSEEFVVTKDTPKRIKIWIDTEINPDYPFEEETTTEETEEETEEEEREGKSRKQREKRKKNKIRR